MPGKDPQEPFARISVGEGKEMIGREDVAVVDVREPHEYNSGHVPDARLIPVASVFARACEMAAAAGLTRLFNLEGGTEAWIKAGYPVVK